MEGELSDLTDWDFDSELDLLRTWLTKSEETTVSKFIAVRITEN